MILLMTFETISARLNPAMAIPVTDASRNGSTEKLVIIFSHREIDFVRP